MLTTREIFFKYVLNNKLLWFIAIANAFVYMVRYGCLDWAPTYLRDAQGYDIKQAGWAYFAYEFAAIPGTLICGWLSDKVFHGRAPFPRSSSWRSSRYSSSSTGSSRRTISSLPCR